MISNGRRENLGARHLVRSAGVTELEDQLAAQVAELRRRGEDPRAYTVRLIAGKPVLCKLPFNP